MCTASNPINNITIFRSRVLVPVGSTKHDEIMSEELLVEIKNKST